jgi:acyl-CoA thioester hydrolase
VVSREAPLPRSAFAAWRRIATRWADNDAYGHVNNTVYYEWFDTAANAWLIENGLLDVERGLVIGLVVATSCAFFAPLTFPDDVEVGLSVERVGRSSVTYRLGVFGIGEEQASAQGRFTHAYVDRDQRRPVRLAEDWRQKLAALNR